MPNSEKLYDVIQQYEEVERLLEDEEIDPIVIKDTLEAIDGEITDKCESIALIIKNKELLASGIQNEIENLKSRLKSISKSVDYLKDYLAMATTRYLAAHPTQKSLETSKVKLSVRTTKSVKLNVDEDEFIKKAMEKGWECFSITTTTSISKTDIKELIKSGVDFEGLATIEENKSLQIK